MKFKYYLRGAGIGILFTTIVLMVSFHIHGSDGRNASDKDDYIEESQASQETEKQDNLSSEMDESKNVPEDEVITNQKPGDTTEAMDDADALDHTGATVTIEVYRGEVCRGVAEDLQACGLVEDSEEFRLYMDQMGYDQKLRVGTFEIPRGSSFEEIAQILIN